MASFKTELNEILNLLKSNQKEILEIKATVAMSAENVSNIYQTTADLSRKIDEVINLTGIKQPLVAKKEPKTQAKKKPDNESESDVGTPKPKPKTKTVTKATKSKTIEKKNKLHGNIMTYFRTKFREDPTYFYSVLNEEETKELLIEYEKNLKTKKGDKKIGTQTDYIYRAIYTNPAKHKALRNLMDKENEEHFKSEGVEAVKDETDGDDDKKTDSDSDTNE
jgi:hypothetical protein